MQHQGGASLSAVDARTVRPQEEQRRKNAGFGDEAGGARCVFGGERPARAPLLMRVLSWLLLLLLLLLDKRVRVCLPPLSHTNINHTALNNNLVKRPVDRAAAAAGAVTCFARAATPPLPSNSHACRQELAYSASEAGCNETSWGV